MENEIGRSTAGICMNQGKCALKIIVEARLSLARPSKIPMDQTLELASEESEGQTVRRSATYQRLIGRSIYLTKQDLT